MSVLIKNIFKIDEYRYDLEYNHPTLGWIPYTVDTRVADPELEPIMVEIYNKILTTGPIQVKAPTTVNKLIPNLTFAQLLIGLVNAKWISEPEGEQWLQGIVPQEVRALINKLPEGMRFAALARATRPSTIARHDPLVVSLAESRMLPPEVMDEFFINCAKYFDTPAPN